MSKPKGFELDGVEAAMARLEGEGYDPSKAQERVAKAAQDAAGSLNTVSWWRESIARFDAAEGVTPKPPAKSLPRKKRH